MTSSSSSMSSFVFVSMILIIMAACPSAQESVIITNKLSSKALIVHCRSKDTDLGAHVVSIGSDLAWSFDDAIFGTTLFWCHLAVGDKRLHFTAYEDLRGFPGRTHWMVNDTGAYFPADLLAYLW
ncbi:S-protein homolog 21 [Linum grandiflorum]